MSLVGYRRLRRHELARLGEIDRSEQIDAMYRVRAGQLQTYPVAIDVKGWEPGQVGEYVDRLQALYDADGVVLGAWHGGRLIGLGSLDVAGVGGDTGKLKLDMLYVSATSRHQGIGRALTQRLAELARARGARSLYISATPTLNTVNAYLRLGARLLEDPDPELVEREPEDIHLLLELHN
jgi:GNAT superfamily N-acetyltransferase